MLHAEAILRDEFHAGQVINVVRKEGEENLTFTAQQRQEEGSSMGAARIELADLKERIKKLEAIASGVDL